MPGDDNCSKSAAITKRWPYSPPPYEDRNTAICLLALGTRDRDALDILLRLEASARVWYLRAVAYARLGRREEALDAYDAAVAADSDMEYRAALDPEISELIKNR